MKAGTTSLAKTLNEIQEISTARVKETDFFTPTKFATTTLAEYHKNFDSTCPIWGEVAPNYGKRDTFPGVAQRIFNYNPEAKIIFIRRDPIARSLSELKMYFEEGEKSHDTRIHWFKHRRSRRWKRQNQSSFAYYRFGDFASNPIVQNSRYDFQLQPYRELFPESLLILDFEEIIGPDSSKVLARLQEFLKLTVATEIKFKKEHISENNLIPSNLALLLSEKSRYLNYASLMYLMPFLRKVFVQVGFLRIQKKTWFSPALYADLQEFFSDTKNQ